MANSVGERARQDAEAAKGRSLDRNLSAEVQGLGQEFNIHTGRPALVREICRKRRLRKKQDWAEEHTQVDNDLAFGRVEAAAKPEKTVSLRFYRVESIELIGIRFNKEIYYDDEEYQRFQERLRALADQVPQYVDIHETSVFDVLLGTPKDVPMEHLGVFRAPHRDLKIERDWEWVKALWRDADDG